MLAFDQKMAVGLQQAMVVFPNPLVQPFNATSVTLVFGAGWVIVSKLPFGTGITVARLDDAIDNNKATQRHIVRINFIRRPLAKPGIHPDRSETSIIPLEGAGNQNFRFSDLAKSAEPRTARPAGASPLDRSQQR